MKVRVFLGFLCMAVTLTAAPATGFADSHRNRTIQIHHIDPARFGPGFEIRIAGVGFQATDVVRVGRFALEDPVITDTEIRGVVPIKTAKALRVVVYRDSVPVASSRDFAFTPIPKVVAVYPAFGQPRRKVTVSGEALDTVTRVKIGIRTIVPDSVSATRVVFTVPDGAQSGMMALVSPLATVYSQSKFEVFYPPTLTGADKSGAYPGETVILTGKHIGSDKAVFKLGPHRLKVLSRHRTAATVVLPREARSGRFSVSCRGNTHVLERSFTVYGEKASGS